eukprot:306306-Rhodomonas_salina.3
MVKCITHGEVQRKGKRMKRRRSSSNKSNSNSNSNRMKKRRGTAGGRGRGEKKLGKGREVHNDTSTDTSTRHQHHQQQQRQQHQHQQQHQQQHQHQHRRAEQEGRCTASERFWRAVIRLLTSPWLSARLHTLTCLTPLAFSLSLKFARRVLRRRRCALRRRRWCVGEEEGVFVEEESVACGNARATQGARTHCHMLAQTGKASTRDMESTKARHGEHKGKTQKTSKTKSKRKRKQQTSARRPKKPGGCTGPTLGQTQKHKDRDRETATETQMKKKKKREREEKTKTNANTADLSKEAKEGAWRMHGPYARPLLLPQQHTRRAPRPQIHIRNLRRVSLVAVDHEHDARGGALPRHPDVVPQPVGDRGVRAHFVGLSPDGDGQVAAVTDLEQDQAFLRVCGRPREDGARVEQVRGADPEHERCFVVEQVGRRVQLHAPSAPFLEPQDLRCEQQCDCFQLAGFRLVSGKCARFQFCGFCPGVVQV